MERLPIFIRDEGYRAYVNLLRSNRGMPALSMDDMEDRWESFDVSGLLPVTPRAEADSLVYPKSGRHVAEVEPA
ncbi:MAG: hypothetical protein K9G48_13800 [Reyranella sp.]|nr:hypothetical protein [Reyranella sp.]